MKKRKGKALRWLFRREEIPQGMTDVHNHLVPGLDDGASDDAEALAMLRGFAEAGYKEIAVSCHLGHPLFDTVSPENITQGVAYLRELAEREGIALSLWPGCEIYYSDLMAEKILAGDVLSVGGSSRYLLIEFSPRDPMQHLKEIAFQLQVRGKQPILAHPERYDAVCKSPEIIRTWSHAGWLMQLDLPSLTGESGPLIKKTAEILLKKRLFHLAASDLHRGKDAKLKLETMLRRLVRLCGEEEAHRLLVTNPSRLIADQPIFEIDREEP